MTTPHPMREIPGWPGYAASPDGKIIRISTGNVLRITNNRVLLLDARKRHRPVKHSTLIALAFLGPRPDGHHAIPRAGATAENVAWDLDPSATGPSELDTWTPPVPDPAAEGIGIFIVADYAAQITLRQRRQVDVPHISPYTRRWVGGIPGDKQHERVLKKRFAEHHIHGTWYEARGLEPWLGDLHLGDLPRWGGEPVTSLEIKQEHCDTHSFFILQLGDTGPIRIGYAKNVRIVVERHRAANFEPVILRRLINAREGLVVQLREQWKDHCIRGDWFRPTPEIIGGVRGLRNAYCY